jgi:uncharacterized protein Yka (UPF0111/DUF47 family)
MDELLELMEETANMLRGMTLDPAIPEHAKSAMRAKIAVLEAAVASHVG